MTTWTQARPLRTEPGNALATEIAGGPALHAQLVVVGALDRLARWEDAEEDLPAELAAELLGDYLRAVAAAAIVADAATGRRQFTGPEDFAANGHAVTLLDQGAVTMGLLSQAVMAAFASRWAPRHLARYACPQVLEEHDTCMRALCMALADAATARLGKAQG